mmetsp:Transcript_50212/g.152712  ORF Transcript_50212/g.152712 Transcript_50212/m.152712 type:complete len:116 (-) Transcript_50212:61-408(-)
MRRPLAALSAACVLGCACMWLAAASGGEGTADEQDDAAAAVGHMLKQMDRNNDGKLSFEEIVSALRPQMKGRGSKFEEALHGDFSAADANGDEALDRSELPRFANALMKEDEEEL